ncbi:MAG: hypothetical protein LBI19_02255 [Oscillospiraceae bacterium]|jgi:hypothetical protein|nr:hypothetical protein [Oscillospiraceae bacterium]
MKKFNKIIACTLVIVMVFSTVNFTFATTPGGMSKADISWWNYIDVYLSYSDTIKLLDKLSALSAPTLKDFYDITKGMITGGTGWFETLLLAFTGEINKDTVSKIRIENNKGQGVIIRFPWSWGPSLPTVRSQSGPAAPAAERVQITVTASPSQGGKTAGGGSILKYVATANNRLTQIQVMAYPNSGWQFDGWYESGTLVNSNVTFSFPAERNRTLEARFKQGGTNSTPSQGQLSVVSSVDGEFIVAIPANTTVYGYTSPTSTSRVTLYTPKTAAYTLYCTKRLTMSDGTTRYFFRSGGSTARDWYLNFTSTMSVEERGTSTPSPISPEADTSKQIHWDTSSVVARATLQAGKTYDIFNTSTDSISLSSNSNSSQMLDYIKYGADGTVTAWRENTYFGHSYYRPYPNNIFPTTTSSRLESREMFRITVNANDIYITIPSEMANSILITESTTPAFYRFILSTSQTYTITSSATHAISIESDSSSERWFDYVKYGADGTISIFTENTYFGHSFYRPYPNNIFPTTTSSRLEPQEKYSITVNPTYDINCYMPYEQAAYLSGIPK